MRLSCKRPAHLLRLILLSSTLCVGGCAGTVSTVTIQTALKCGPMIPESYRKPVPGVPLPPKAASVGQIGDALDGQTRNLDTANGRTADVIAITEACDARSAEVAEQLKPKKWWPF